MLAQTDKERELYEARLKYTRDEAARQDYATDKGRAQGRAQGRAEATREMILRVGSRQWGIVPRDVATSLEAITSTERLEDLVDRVLDSGSNFTGWDEFAQAEL